MKTYHVYRVVYADDGAEPPVVVYFVGDWVGKAMTNVMNGCPTGVKREIFCIERVLTNVMNPDA